MFNNDIYISSCITNNKKDLIELAKRLKAGIEICDFLDPAVLNGNFDTVLQDYYKNFSQYDLKLAIHAPFFDLNHIAIEEAVKKITIHRYNQCFKAATVLKAKTVVFHAGYNSMIKMDFYPEYFKENQIKFWSEYIKRFEDNGIVAVLENTYEDDPSIISAIIEGVNSKNLKFCLDTGHANIYSKISVYEWIKQAGQNLYHIHMHNNSGLYDEHNSILKGNIDFNLVMKILSELNLNPDLSLEIFNQEAAEESINFLDQFNATKLNYS